MHKLWLRPRPGALIMCKGIDMLYAVKQLTSDPATVLAQTFNRREEIPEDDAWTTPCSFYRSVCRYVCWNCLEPAEAHVRRKCPFAATQFLLRKRRGAT